MKVDILRWSQLSILETAACPAKLQSTLMTLYNKASTAGEDFQRRLWLGNKNVEFGVRGRNGESGSAGGLFDEG